MSKKEIFLHRLKSPSGKHKYKRYLGTSIRYPGGKSLAVGYIIQLLPENVKRVISPFIGGGSVEIAMANELEIEVIGYDIFDILVNYWQVQLDEPEELYRKLSRFSPTKETYQKVKEKLKAHWKGEITLNSLDLAAYYYFNHNLSYGPGFLGWASKVYLNEKKYLSTINKVRNFKAPNLTVYCDTFENVIKKYPFDFLYCDPPYYLEGDSKMFKGIYPQRNFPIHHNNFKHRKLYELLKNHKGGFILSYNDCSQIRKWYKDYEIYTPSWQYTMGQGETRIGLNRMRNGSNNVKKSHELLIYKPSEL
ncbi:DNA adenine methylase [bacterium]|nr:DNA adenine methylase [bacterium]